MTDAATTGTREETPTVESVIDRSTLDQLLEDVGADNAQAVLDAFVQELEAQTGALAEAADRADLGAMAQSAHRLKSSAASFGAIRLSQSTAAIEEAAKAGDLSAAAGRMGEFRRLSEASFREMERFRQELAGGDGHQGD